LASLGGMPNIRLSRARNAAIAEALGVSPVLEEHLLAYSQDGLWPLLSYRLNGQIFLHLQNSNVKLVRIQTRNHRSIHTDLAVDTLGSGDVKWYGLGSNEADACDTMEMLLQFLEDNSVEYPELESVISSGKEWLDKKEAKVSRMKSDEKSKRSKEGGLVWALIIGVVALFLYVSATSDPNRCIYTPDPRGGYTDC